MILVKGRQCFGGNHYAVFLGSLGILPVTLRRDMYNLRRPGTLAEEYILSQDQDVPRHAQYSCVYWVDHPKAANDLQREKCMSTLQDDGIVASFPVGKDIELT